MARGDLHQITEGAEVTDFTFDAADRLAGVDMPGGAQVAFTYDADGQHVSQTADGQTTEYLWDAYSAHGDVVLETSAAGEVSYTLANGQLIAQTRGGLPTYYLTDGQGSTRALADASGAITDTYDYTAFGELIEQTGSTDNSYLYTGQQFDEVTGLYSLRARYYNPALGRFLSQDTAGVLFGNPIELNRYGYTANNPINRSDPSGYMLIETAKVNEEPSKHGAPELYQIGSTLKNEFEGYRLTVRIVEMIATGAEDAASIQLLAEIQAFLTGNAIIQGTVIATTLAYLSYQVQVSRHLQPAPSSQSQPQATGVSVDVGVDVDVECAEGDPDCDDEQRITLYHKSLFGMVHGIVMRDEVICGTI